MACGKLNLQSVDEWIRLTDASKPRKDRVLETANLLINALADWEARGESTYLTERIRQMEHLTVEKGLIQNNPATTPEQGAAVQDKINKVSFQGNAMLLWLEMSDAGRAGVCLAFDREGCFKHGSMCDHLLLRLSRAEEREKRPDIRALRKIQEFFRG